MNYLFLLILSFFNLNPDYFYKQACLNEIKKHESLQLCTYKDPNGSQLCIGYGHKTNEYKTITEQEANRLLEADFDKRLKIVKERNPDLSYNKQLALAMALYNLNWESYKKIEKNPSSWEKYFRYKSTTGMKISSGLKERREFEYRLWNN